MKYAVTTQMTKTAMANALKKIMAKKSLEKITVREIIEDCGLNRQTFYYHFQDIYDLVKWMFEQDIIVLLKKGNRYITWDEGIRLIVSYIKDNKRICTCVLNSMGQEQLQRLFYKDVEKFMDNLVCELKGDLKVSKKYSAFISKFYTLAFAGYLVQWIKDGMKETPEEIIHLIRVTMKGNIKAALERALQNQAHVLCSRLPNGSAIIK